MVSVNCAPFVSAEAPGTEPVAAPEENVEGLCWKTDNNKQKDVPHWTDVVVCFDALVVASVLFVHQGVAGRGRFILRRFRKRRGLRRPRPEPQERGPSREGRDHADDAEKDN